MKECCFCHRALPRGGRCLPLCGECMDQVTQLWPELKTYDWFVRALREALTGGKAPYRTPKSSLP